MWAKIITIKITKDLKTSVCVHWIYVIHKFNNLIWITEINELFNDILIYWDAHVYSNVQVLTTRLGLQAHACNSFYVLSLYKCLSLS